MTHWSDSAVQIARQIGGPARVLVALDFDGTLAPIVAHPNDAALPEATIEILRKLAAARGTNVAFVSGRALADLSGRIAVEGAYFVGNHGLEIQGPGMVQHIKDASAHVSRLRPMAAESRARLKHLPGVFLEDKELTLSLHLRNMPCEARAEAQAIMQQVAAENPNFRMQRGHMVLELIPDAGRDKGTAIQQILHHLRLGADAALYAGDDTTDEAAFESLPESVTICVGPARTTAARWKADDPADVFRLLEWLLKNRDRGH